MQKTTWMLAGLMAASLAMPALAAGHGGQGHSCPHGKHHGKHHGKGHCPHHGGKHHKMGKHGMWGGPLKHLDGRLAFIKAEIKITDAQAKAWDEFSAMLRTVAEARHAMRKERIERHKNRAGHGKPKSLPERLARREARMTARLARIKLMREGFESFFAVLDEGQKATANKVIPMMFKIGKRGHGKHHGKHYRKGHKMRHHGGHGKGKGPGGEARAEKKTETAPAPDKPEAAPAKPEATPSEAKPEAAPAN
ncbi:MAG: Spy/CpxP family protein refolding chaperone [Filomicrobium sp.]